MARFPTRAIVAALALLGGAARADGFQDSRLRNTTMLAVGWEAAVPNAGLRQYVDRPGYYGIQVEARRGIGRSLSLGLATSWTWLAQSYTSKEIAYPDATVSGPLYQRVRFVTVRGTAHWYLGTGSLQPYVGVGAGGLSWETYRNVGGWVRSRSDWALTADPQLGFLWTISSGAALHVQARYQYSTARFDEVDRASWLGIEVGIAAY